MVKARMGQAVGRVAHLVWWGSSSPSLWAGRAHLGQAGLISFSVGRWGSSSRWAPGAGGSHLPPPSLWAGGAHLLGGLRPRAGQGGTFRSSRLLHRQHHLPRLLQIPRQRPPQTVCPRSGHPRSGHPWSGPVWSAPAWPGLVGPVWPGLVGPGPARSSRPRLARSGRPWSGRPWSGRPWSGRPRSGPFWPVPVDPPQAAGPWPWWSCFRAQGSGLRCAVEVARLAASLCALGAGRWALAFGGCAAEAFGVCAAQAFVSAHVYVCTRISAWYQIRQWWRGRGIE